MTIFVQCLLINTLEYHDTFDFVQDTETEDPKRRAHYEDELRKNNGTMNSPGPKENRGNLFLGSRATTNFSVTCNSFREFHTSDWLQYV